MNHFLIHCSDLGDLGLKSENIVRSVDGTILLGGLHDKLLKASLAIILDKYLNV